MSAKIWVVVAGEYSDQSVDAVFTNETNARLYADAFDYGVSESGLDPDLDPHVAAGEKSWWIAARKWRVLGGYARSIEQSIRLLDQAEMSDAREHDLSPGHERAGA